MDVNWNKNISNNEQKMNRKDIKSNLFRNKKPKILKSKSNEMYNKKPLTLKSQSLPYNINSITNDDCCREFDNFAGEWIDTREQNVLISPWGVIRYPNNPKLRFEAVYIGPNILYVTFDKDPTKKKFVGKLNHDCNILVWSNNTKWIKKNSTHYHKILNSNHKKNNSKDCIIQ